MIAGIVTQMPSLMYSSAGVTSSGLMLSIYLYAKQRRKEAVFEVQNYIQRVYRDPGMKKNKSDTNLELMGAPKNTTDESAVSDV